ncbi:nicotinate phosphoribosyltransferase [Kallotenue papyrolyticum]|uniref:nicotinate phosphoribosyltransferase n=1 Tax=Kallotenue papyrolyticum TaxID=1325125 RepID=UPI0004928438|nr:nicotinate phosphoribosyltransferase [Kallotenue papyrolyticum]
MQPDEQQIAEGFLFTDQYQLTMAQLYYRLGIHERRARFEHFFRSYPDYGSHQAGYCVNAGLAWLLDWMSRARFSPRDRECLARQRGRAGTPVFAPDFLDWLSRYGSFDGLRLEAIPEGRVVHPNTPLTVVEGPLAQAQILETALLNQLNYQTLVATKAARVQHAARGQAVLEFGLRRGQATGANAGTRAALIGGAQFSSNVGVSHVLGLPPKGTHAHSMVQFFLALGEGELAAFRAYAEVYPDDCLLLVDTVDTLGSGVPNAIRVFEELRRKGHQPVGIRIDSGDLAYLSIQAAKMLDQAGFPDTLIVLSNKLDELVIWQIIAQIEAEAPRAGLDADRLIRRLVFGVGTRLITSRGAPALDGVYKLVAVQHHGQWLPAIKRSDSPEKVVTPGEKQLWRIYDARGKATADLVCLADEDPRRQEELILHHPSDPMRWRRLPRAAITALEPLLVEVWREGMPVGQRPSLEDMRALRQADEQRLDAGVRRLINPHVYHVSLSERLWELKQRLMRSALAQPADTRGA